MTDTDRQGPDPAVAQIWARRAAELARVPPRRQEGEQLDLLVFCLGRETFAFEARYASDIRPASAQPITRVPRVPAFVAGVIHLRGRILTVLDLARFLELAGPQEGGAGSQRHVLVVDHPGLEWALLVDRVLAVHSVALDQLRAAGDTLSSLPGPYVRGIAPDSGPCAGAGGPLVVLDLPALLADETLIIREEMI